ncbi:MAG: ribonuclease J, partial [Sulfurovum sp.]
MQDNPNNKQGAQNQEQGQGTQNAPKPTRERRPNPHRQNKSLKHNEDNKPKPQANRKPNPNRKSQTTPETNGNVQDKPTPNGNRRNNPNHKKNTNRQKPHHKQGDKPNHAENRVGTGNKKPANKNRNKRKNVTTVNETMHASLKENAIVKDAIMQPWKQMDISSKGKIRFTPLGGLGEIGGNMAVLETETTAIIIDVGMSFPDETMHGVD